jgi:hypothetical protein
MNVTALLGGEMKVLALLSGAGRQACHLVGKLLKGGIRASFDPGRLPAFKPVAVDLLPVGESDQGQGATQSRSKQGS